TLKASWNLEDASAWAARFLPIPGKFTGGKFTGHANLTGDRTNPATTAAGSFSLAETGFMPPKQVLGGPVRPIRIVSATGKFNRTGRETVLNELKLNSSLGQGTGTVTARDNGSAHIVARADVAQLEDLINL